MLVVADELPLMNCTVFEFNPHRRANRLFKHVERSGNNIIHIGTDIGGGINAPIASLDYEHTSPHCSVSEVDTILEGSRAARPRSQQSSDRLKILEVDCFDGRVHVAVWDADR